MKKLLLTALALVLLAGCGHKEEKKEEKKEKKEEVAKTQPVNKNSKKNEKPKVHPKPEPKENDRTLDNFKVITSGYVAGKKEKRIFVLNEPTGNLNGKKLTIRVIKNDTKQEIIVVNEVELSKIVKTTASETKIPVYFSIPESGNWTITLIINGSYYGETDVQVK